MENLCDFSQGDHLVRPPFLEPIQANRLSSQTGLLETLFLGAVFLYKSKYCTVLVHFVLPVL